MKEASTIREGDFEDTHTELILKRLTVGCIAITAGISGLAIIGWALNWLLLARISPVYIPMAQSTALSFLILSFALFVYARKPKHHQAITLAKAGAFLVLMLSLINLIGFFTGSGLDIEQVLYPQPEKFDGVPIGRMSLVTAADFLLSAGALLLLLISPEGRHRAKSAASSLAVIVGSAGLVMVLGYLYGTPLLYGGSIIPVALTTAIAFLSMGTGLVAAAGQDYFPVSSFAGSSVRARLMRAFVPVTIAIILINGFLDIVISPLMDNNILASSLAAISSVILVGIVIERIARVIGGNIDHADAERKQAEEELRKYREHLEDLVKERTKELNEAQEALVNIVEDLNEKSVQLAQAMEQSQSADRLKSAFLSTMSHELRTPLNSIIGFTGIVLQGMAGPLNEEQAKQLAMVKSSANHLLDLINDVLDISKIEVGQVQIARQSFDMRPVIETVLRTVLPLAAKKGLSLDSVIASDVGVIISDRRRVEQILINLVNNAVKFTEQGKIRISAIRRGIRTGVPNAESGTSAHQRDFVEISVTDTGIGIKAEDMGKLFMPFSQIDTGLTRNHEGTGLGLSICGKLVEMLGGTIRVESEWGKGSTFTITLPLT